MSSIPSQLPQFVTAARSGALQALALQAGQVIDAKILGAAPGGGTQVEIRGQLLNLLLPTAVKAGETIKLEVQGSGLQLRLALQLPPGTAPAAPAQPAPAAPQVSVPLQASPAPAMPAPTVPTQQGAQGAPTPPVPVPAPSNPPQQGAVSAGQAPIPSATVQGGAQAVPAAVVPQTTAAPVPPSPPAPAPLPQVAGAPAASLPPGTPPPPTAQMAMPAAGYPAAPAQAVSNPLAVAAAATAAVPSAPAGQPAVRGAVRPVVAATTLANATAQPSPGNPSPLPQAAPATTPQAALAQMVHAAVPRQGSVTGLTTALASIAGKVVLPEPVARAAQQVLAGRVTIDAPRFDGAVLQAAIRGSGVFQEASLAQGQPLLPQADMKTALLTLRQTLTAWLGQQQAPIAPVAQMPPPLRGTTPRARAGEVPQLDPGAPPEEVGKQLLERTESALARVRLHQHASLSDPTGRTADWSMDIPVMVGSHQTLMQLQIHRDQHNESEASGERGWQMKFALNLPGMGEVGAQVSLRAGTVGVMLWATEPAASAALDAEIAALRETLGGAGLHPGSVIVRHGEPPVPAAAPSGHFVDSRS